MFLLIAMTLDFSVDYNLNHINKSIVLLPDIKETFTYSQDKQLSDKAFMQKCNEEILARYKLDDLSDVESEEILADSDEMKEIEYYSI